ncbi:hypothetical protein ACFU6R_12460 [Streptomyces sp. NPDC057499]|uniref:hypothetical protein n=1 Tax=Streptomyces sp. NPDC057499 TaxID=3346150 RepID=UPI0036CAB2F4
MSSHRRRRPAGLVKTSAGAASIALTMGWLAFVGVRGSAPGDTANADVTLDEGNRDRPVKKRDGSNSGVSVTDGWVSVENGSQAAPQGGTATPASTQPSNAPPPTSNEEQALTQPIAPQPPNSAPPAQPHADKSNGQAKPKASGKQTQPQPPAQAPAHGSRSKGDDDARTVTVLPGGEWDQGDYGEDDDEDAFDHLRDLVNRLKPRFGPTQRPPLPLPPGPIQAPPTQNETPPAAPFQAPLQPAEPELFEA